MWIILTTITGGDMGMPTATHLGSTTRIAHVGFF